MVIVEMFKNDFVGANVVGKKYHECSRDFRYIGTNGNVVGNR